MNELEKILDSIYKQVQNGELNRKDFNDLIYDIMQDEFTDGLEIVFELENDLTEITPEQLEEDFALAIELEHYEQAEIINDEIKRRKYCN